MAVILSGADGGGEGARHRWRGVGDCDMRSEAQVDSHTELPTVTPGCGRSVGACAWISYRRDSE